MMAARANQCVWTGGLSPIRRSAEIPSMKKTVSQKSGRAGILVSAPQFPHIIGTDSEEWQWRVIAFTQSSVLSPRIKYTSGAGSQSSVFPTGGLSPIRRSAEIPSVKKTVSQKSGRAGIEGQFLVVSC